MLNVRFRLLHHDVNIVPRRVYASEKPLARRSPPPRRRGYRQHLGSRTVVLTPLLVLVALTGFPFQRTSNIQAAADTFTIAVLPDTQNYIKYDAPPAQVRSFAQQTQWIRAHVGTHNIVFVTHEGDVVNNGGAHPVEWERADAAMDRLDGVVPYSTVLGNKDLERVNDPTSGAATYLRYFGPSRYQSYPWYGEASSNELNQYQVFSAGRWTFLHLALELEVPDATIRWAQTVLDAHPGMPTIVTTHAYQRDDTGRSTTPAYGGNSGEAIWQKLIKPNAQIFMVLNGHSGEVDGERHQVSRNAAGLPVYEMIANYQGYPNGGNGYFRLLQFVPSVNQLRVRTYSPTLNTSKTDADSHFTLALNFNQRFGSQVYLPLVLR